MKSKWSASTLRDLRLWLITERLPPGVTFEDLAEAAEMAAKKCQVFGQHIAELQAELHERDKE
jgi:hypothetical protein